MLHRIRVWLVILAVLGVGAGIVPAAPASAADDTQYFKETRHSVSGTFLQYWRNNGGLDIYGYPISDPQNEVDPETGKTFLTQWFERARFELHPENAGTKYEVLLGLLGKQLTETRQDLSAFEEAQPTNQAGNVFYPETRHNLNGTFKAFWETHGGLAQFGYPLSEEFQELNPEDGQTYTVQYFERTRFEYHPEFKGTRYEVELGLLGKQFWGPLAYQARLTGQRFTVSVATDRQDNVYVLNADIRHVFKYDASLKYLADWGSQGDNPGQFQDPRGIAIDGQGNVFVADRYLITKFDNKGEVLKRWGSQGTGQGQFATIRNIAVDGQGNLFVADPGNLRVTKFDNNGQFLTAWGSEGIGDGQFLKGDKRLHVGGPADLAIDGQGNVYVTNDASDERASTIQKFDNNGKFLLKWSIGIPTALAADKDGNVYLGGIGPSGNTFTKYDSSGHVIYEAGKQMFGLAAITGIATDSQGNILIASSGYLNSAVQKYRQR